MPLEPEAEKLYRSAMRQRLTRAGLLKIMKENEAREASKEAKESDGEEPDNNENTVTNNFNLRKDD